MVFERLESGRTRVVFHSKSGPLPVERRAERLVRDFPVNTFEPAPDSPALVSALGRAPLELYSGFQRLALCASEADVRALRPDMAALIATGIHGIIATGSGSDCDFVARFFAPAAGVHATRSGASRDTKAGIDPFFNRESLQVTAAMYLARQNPDQELLSPATRADLTGFPPLPLQVGTNELGREGRS